MQNRLEQIWKRIDMLQSRAISKEVAFLTGATRTTSSFLDRLFGHKLMSLQFVAVSMAFSLGSLWIMSNLSVVLFNIRARVTFSYLHACLFLSRGLVLFFLGSLPALVSFDKALLRRYCWIAEKRAYYYIVIALVVSLSFGWFFEQYLFLRHLGRIEVGLYGEPPYDTIIIRGGLMALLVAAGAFVDMVFVIFFRWVLRRIGRVSGLWNTILWLLAICVSTIILVGPGITKMLSFPAGNSYSLKALFSLISMTNLIDALCLLLLIIIMTLLLLHKLIWPLIKRPIYAANRKGLVSNSKLLGGLGTVFLLYAFPNNFLVKWLTDFLPKLKGGG